MPRNDLPSGQVTFLFTDIEGSTRLLEEVGEARYEESLADHRSKLRTAFGRHGGVEVDTQGDAFFYAFADPGEAVAAATEAQEALADGPVRVRMGLHTGEPRLSEEGYVGREVHRGARVAAAGHGGQVVLSKETRDLVTVEVTDLGEHRVKDFAEPVWIFQLGSERFPPLKTISNTNLPRPASPFVGRDREVQEVTALLGDGTRLLALTGPGGSGKTRLAIEAATELVPEFKNGVFWVALAPLRDPSLVIDTIAQTLGAKDGLAEHIGEREMLLLLDNLEQVIEAAPEVASLVEACPNLKLLVTTRELLRVRGEVEYPVPPLADPDAVELFCTRTRLDPDETIAELCRRLDNLPLAVELAAARTSVLSPAQILERLAKRLDLLKGGRDAEARQQTLRATIEWSHELLPEEEKDLFARLAVFAGGCTLEAAESIAGADLDKLQSLVHKSLLRHTGERFWMLETIQEYAAERLMEAGEADELRRRHAEHFLALGEEADPHLFGRQESSEWLDRLGREHDNLRAALDHLMASAEIQLALRLAGAVWVFWRDRAHFAEGRRRLESILRADESPTADRAKALNAAASMAGLSGDAATARRWAKEGLELNSKLGDVRGSAESELWLGWALAMDDDWAAAQPLFEDAARRYGELEDEDEKLTATAFLAMTWAELGDGERARALDEANLARARQLGNEQIEAIALDGLARHALHEGRLGEALSLAAESLATYHRLDDPHGVAIELRRSACALALQGRAETAARLVAGADAVHKEIGGMMPWVARMKDQALTSIRAQLDESTFAEAWERGRALSADEAVALAFAEVGSDA